MKVVWQAVAVVIALTLVATIMFKGAKSAADSLFTKQVAGRWKLVGPIRMQPDQILEVREDHTYSFDGEAGKWQRNRGQIVFDGKLGAQHQPFNVVKDQMFDGVPDAAHFEKLKS